MGYVVKFPQMEVIDEKDFSGDISCVGYADDELVVLTKKYFMLAHKYNNLKSSMLLKFFPLVRKRKLDRLVSQSQDCITQIKKNLYSKSGRLQE